MSNSVFMDIDPAKTVMQLGFQNHPTSGLFFDLVTNT
jgi:hypothetical protein